MSADNSQKNIDRITAVMEHAANNYTPTGAVSFGGDHTDPDTVDGNVTARIDAVIVTIPDFSKIHDGILGEEIVQNDPAFAVSSFPLTTPEHDKLLRDTTSEGQILTADEPFIPSTLNL